MFPIGGRAARVRDDGRGEVIAPGHSIHRRSLPRLLPRSGLLRVRAQRVRAVHHLYELAALQQKHQLGVSLQQAGVQPPGQLYRLTDST